MAATSPSSSQGFIQLFRVRNTFIEPIINEDADDEDDVPLTRTHSDTTGIAQRPAPIPIPLPATAKTLLETPPIHKLAAEFAATDREAKAARPTDLSMRNDANKAEGQKQQQPVTAWPEPGPLPAQSSPRQLNSDDTPNSGYPPALSLAQATASSYAASRSGSDLAPTPAYKCNPPYRQGMSSISQVPQSSGYPERGGPKTPGNAQLSWNETSRRQRTQKRRGGAASRQQAHSSSCGEEEAPLSRPDGRTSSDFQVMGPPAEAVAEPFTSLMTSKPWLGNSHTLHPECKDMGLVREDFRAFTKTAFEGRLSLLSESSIKTRGRQNYLVRFTNGELSKADGVGFVFTQMLPCTKNIQRIKSIFVNQRGHICLRVNAEVIRFSICTKPLEVGDLIGLSMDLDGRVANFVIWPHYGGPPSQAAIAFGPSMFSSKSKTAMDAYLPGTLAFVIKNVGTAVEILS